MISLLDRKKKLREITNASPEDYDNTEGFTVRFIPENPDTPSFRVKMKHAEYVRLHRIVTGVNSKTIWEYLSQQQPLDELLERVPDEFFDWVQATVRDLNQQYAFIEESARQEFTRQPQKDDRKTPAQAFASSDNGLFCSGCLITETTRHHLAEHQARR